MFVTNSKCVNQLLIAIYLSGLVLGITQQTFANNDTTRVLSSSYKVVETKAKYGQNQVAYRPQKNRSFRQFTSNKPYINAEQEASKLLDKLYAQKLLVNDSTVKKKIEDTHKLHDFVKNNDLLIRSLNLNAPIQLPVGIHRVIGETEYIVLVDSILVDPNGNARLNTHMSLTTPGGRRLAFEGSMTVSAEGGLVGEAKLKLLTDVPIKFAKGVLLNLKGGGTFVSVDCSGFKELGLSGELTFTNLVKDSIGGIQGEEPIVTTFETQIRSWNDLVVKLNMPDFQIKGVKGLGFRVEDAVFDFSDVRNATGFTLPENYDASWLPQPNSVLWQGVYFRSMKIALPRFLKTTHIDSANKDTMTTASTLKRIEFYGENLVLDATGFTGKITVKDMVSRRQGNLDGWAFSIEHLSFALQANTLNYFDIEGKINLPIAKDEKDSYLSYKAMLDFAKDEFLFAAGTNRPINIPMFGGKSKLELTQTYLEAKIAQGKVYPKAILTGKFTIENKILNIDEIRFEGLELSSNGVDKFDVRFGKKEAGNFPIQIIELGLMTEREVTESDSTGMLSDIQQGDETAYLGLKLGVQINFTDKLPAEGYVTLIGAKVKEGGRHKWRYKGTQIHGAKIDVDQGPYMFKGFLKFFKNDKVYGNGFNGNIMLGISTGSGKGFGMRATAIFGKVKGMRYWYADALAAFSPGLKLGPTGLSIYGFGGGLYSRMRKEKGYEDKIDSDLGRTATGTVYIPDAGTKLGLKATVVLGTASSTKPFQGEVTFEMSFNQHGGIKYIGFEGYAYFLNKDGKVKIQDLVKAPEDRRGTVPVSAQVIIDYDVENQVFHMVAGVQINLQKSSAKITGGGQMVMHFAPDEWYIHIGTPENRLQVNAELTGIKLSSGLYFMTGTSVPEIPPPPAEILNILGMSAKTVDSRDQDDLLAGKGFAIGFSLDVKRKFEAFVYFQAHIGMGFDISYKKYAPSVSCAGRDGSVGINGWFGQGQAYIFAKGSLGVKFRRKRFSLGSVSAALLAQMQFVNPLWAKGTLGGRFRILGGLVKGRFKISVEIGKHCDLQGANQGADLLADVQIISDITPTDLNGAVDVFTMPQVAFNMPIGKIFKIEDNNGYLIDFRARLDKLDVKANGQSLPGALKWSNNNEVVLYQTLDVLPAQSQITVAVKLVFEERRAGRWQIVSEGDSAYVETKQASFTSGTAPSYVPLFNIASSYPVLNQLHFHKGETNTGFIQLHIGQAYLFGQENSSEWAAQKIQWTNTQTGEKKTTDFTYNVTAKRLEFDVAGADLSNTTIYQLDIVNLPKENPSAVDENVRNDAKTIITSNDTITVANNQITASQKNYQEQSILDEQGIFFRTSKYNTLTAKFDALTIKDGALSFVAPYVDIMHSYISGDELFDKAELSGVSIKRNGYKYVIPRLVQLEIDLPKTAWFQQKLHPEIYEGYPFAHGIRINWRNPNWLGTPPKKAVKLFQWERGVVLNPVDLSYPTIHNSGLRILFELAHFASNDLFNLQQNTANVASLGRPLSTRLREMLIRRFSPMLYGDYPIKIHYVLPKDQGKKITTIDRLLKTQL